MATNQPSPTNQLNQQKPTDEKVAVIMRQMIILDLDQTDKHTPRDMSGLPILYIDPDMICPPEKVLE